MPSAAPRLRPVSLAESKREAGERTRLQQLWTLAALPPVRVRAIGANRSALDAWREAHQSAAASTTSSTSAIRQCEWRDVRVPQTARSAQWCADEWLELLDWAGALLVGALDAVRPASADDEVDDLSSYRLPTLLDDSGVGNVSGSLLRDTFVHSSTLLRAFDALVELHGRPDFATNTESNDNSKNAFAMLVVRCKPQADDENDRSILVTVNRDALPTADDRVQIVCVGTNLQTFFETAQ